MSHLIFSDFDNLFKNKYFNSLSIRFRFYLSFRRMSCIFFILFGKRSTARKDSLYHSNMVGGRSFSFRWQLAKYVEQIYICWLWKLMLQYYQYRVASCIHQLEYRARRTQSTLSLPCLQKKTDGKKQMGQKGNIHSGLLMLIMN